MSADVQPLEYISRPPLPELFQQSLPVALQGVSQGSWNEKIHPKPVDARFNCCWIEGNYWCLVTDPGIRWFLTDYWARCELGQDSWIVPVPLHSGVQVVRTYEEGKVAMRYLAFRHRHGSLTQYRLNTEITAEMQLWRDCFQLNGELHNMGEMLLPRLLSALRFFIALNWPSNAFQKSFIAYQSQQVHSITTQCTSLRAACPSTQSILASRPGEVMDSPCLAIVPTRDVSQLSDLLDFSALDEGLSVRWTLTMQMCQRCNTHLEMRRRSLVTLPWMLFIQLDRTTDEAKRAPVVYDPDSLLLGPTSDNHYARYKLVCRVQHAFGHFIAHVRQRDGSFTELNFDKVTPEFSLPRPDRTCVALVWQRVD
jgi:hypothetical protein